MNLKLQKLSKMSMTFLMALFSVWGWAQTPIYSTGFEAGFAAGTNYQTTVTTGPSGGQWKTFYGTPSSTDPLVGGKSLQMRLYNNGNMGYTQTEFGTANISRVTFKAKAASGISVKVGYSIDGGTSWLGEQTITLATSVGDYEYLTGLVGSNSDVRIKFTLVGTPPNSGNRQLFIDDVNFYAPATQTAAPTIMATGISNGTDNFWNTAQIALESSTSGASIYYTVDNSDPTTSSIQYSTPFSVSSTSTIKAIAIDGTGSLSNSVITSKTITISSPATSTVPYSQAFNNTLGDWINYVESGNANFFGWEPKANGAESNGHQKGDTKAWLISPKFTGVQANSLLSFGHTSQYQGEDLTVKYSTDYLGYGDPSLATWSDLTTITEAAGTAVSTGNLSNFAMPVSGNIHIAFLYDDTTANGGWALWRVNNLTIDAPVQITTTWNGTAWSNGTPATAVDAVIEGLYSTSAQAVFTAKNITIKNGGVLEIASGNTIGAVDVTVEDGGNLVQKEGSSLAFTGNFKVLKSGTSAINKYAFWSSPVSGQNLTAIYGAANTPEFITEYNTATDYFVNVGTNTTSVFAKGYSIKTPAVSNVTFEGVPNNSIQTYALSTSGNGFNLVGNPYSSALSLIDFYNTNIARISSTLYFWDNKSNAVTTQAGATTVNVGYATYNAQSATWTPAPNTSGSAIVPAGNVANIGQGFIVKTLNTTVDTSLTFNNDMRVATAGSFFNKNNTSSEGKIWLKLSSSYNTNNTFAVAYMNGASDSFDNYDSKAIGMGSDAFYTLADAQKLVIQGKTGFDIDDVVPVGTKHFENGNFTVSLIQKEGLFDNGQPVYLHDKVTGIYTDLQNSSYSFTANSGETSSRFEIVYKLNVLSTSEVKKDSFEVYRDGEDFFVRNDKNIDGVQIFDATGRKIQDISAQSKVVRVKLESKGLYILKATSAGKEYTKKLIK